MKQVRYFALYLVMLLSLTYAGFSQLSEDYDQRERAVDPFEDEDKLLREKKLDQIVNRIKRGDQTVLRLVVFDTLEAVHDELVKRDTESGAETTYYEVIGGASALPAYIGGFDNQDPKVRLKCIGFLGDWVDEVGKNMELIERAVDKRLATNIETRKEVRYGYRILKMKIVRRRILSALKEGDKKVLVKVSPEEFLPLVFYEPRIRTIYLGSPGAVRIRSVVLDPGIEPETGHMVSSRPGRAEGFDIERICYSGVASVTDTGEVAQWLTDIRQQGQIEDAAATGGYVGGGTHGSGSADEGTRGAAMLDWKCVQAIFTGLDNKSLFVREHSARIFLNYIRGYTGDTNYLGNVAGSARAINKVLASMAKNPYYVRVAQVAWDNVKWSEYNYMDRVTDATNYPSFVQHKYYLEYEYADKNSAAATQRGEQRGRYKPTSTYRYFTQDASTYPEWGSEVSGNYRNDVKEILRVMGLSWYIDAEYIVEGVSQSVQRTRVDTLFNDKSRPDRPKSPDRSDRLEGESATTYIGPEQR